MQQQICYTEQRQLKQYAVNLASPWFHRYMAFPTTVTWRILVWFYPVVDVRWQWREGNLDSCIHRSNSGAIPRSESAIRTKLVAESCEVMWANPLGWYFLYGSWTALTGHALHSTETLFPSIHEWWIDVWRLDVPSTSESSHYKNGMRPMLPPFDPRITTYRHRQSIGSHHHYHDHCCVDLLIHQIVGSLLLLQPALEFRLDIWYIRHHVDHTRLLNICTWCHHSLAVSLSLSLYRPTNSGDNPAPMAKSPTGYHSRSRPSVPVLPFPVAIARSPHCVFRATKVVIVANRLPCRIVPIVTSDTDHAHNDQRSIQSYDDTHHNQRNARYSSVSWPRPIRSQAGVGQRPLDDCNPRPRRWHCEVTTIDHRYSPYPECRRNNWDSIRPVPMMMMMVRTRPISPSYSLRNGPGSRNDQSTIGCIGATSCTRLVTCDATSATILGVRPPVPHSMLRSSSSSCW